MYFLPLTTGLASLILPGALYALALGSSSSLTAPTLPPQLEGESLGTFLDRLFSDETGNFPKNTSPDGSNSKRGTDLVDLATSPDPASYVSLVDQATSPYNASYGLHQSFWEEHTDSGSITYNISADFSSCGNALTLGTDFGVYTFANGTTTNSTKIRDMVADLYAMRHSRQSPNPNYANHTAALGRLGLETGNQLLGSGLICRNTSTTPTQTELIVHQELRHLLANKHSYWAAIILGAVGGAVGGAGIAAIVDQVWYGNVTSSNVVQTALVVGSVVIITGILNRLDQIGRLDRAEIVAHNVRDLVPQSREAIVQNIYIGWARRQMQRIIRRQVEEALSEHGVGSAVGSNPATPGSVTPGSVPGTPGSTAFGSCLSEMEAGEAATALGEMTDINLNLEPIQEVIEQLGQRDEQGACSSP